MTTLANNWLGQLLFRCFARVRIAVAVIFGLGLGLGPVTLFAQTAPLADIQAIAAGVNHTCALTGAGGVKCWGQNFYGQLGDNSTLSRLAPVDVSGLSSGVTAIAAGGYHTCALAAGGGVKCWGRNYEGQLGDNSTTLRLTPVDVLGLPSGITAIAAGYGHTCVLDNIGGVICWGGNGSGQLGNNSTTGSLMPVNVSGLASGVAAIAAGSNHTCALASGGGVKCWGSNSNGQLGNDSTTQSLIPVSVTGLTSGVAAIAGGGYHTCALSGGGGVMCWGHNDYGQVGDNSTMDRLTPADVNGLASEVTFIATGESHTCASNSSGGVKCWGFNYEGQLGDNSYATRLTPVDVWELSSGATAVAAGRFHSCALVSAGKVKCWGTNGYGQLGDGTGVSRPIPGDVAIVVVPEAPTMGIATPGDTSASVRFFANGNGGAAIDQFRVSCNPGAVTATGSASPIVVPGLVNGTTYTCTAAAHNTLGWSAESAASNSITPPGTSPPSAPTSAFGTPANGRISVAFTASSDPGSLVGRAAASITAYTATCGSRTATGIRSPVVVGGLSNGTSYTCTVTASNNVPLTSAPSLPSAAVTPMATVPSAPGIGVATPGDGIAAVSFSPPADDGGAAIDGYRVTCNPGSHTASGSLPSISVTGLANGGSYACTVAAHNGFGWSAESSLSNPVLPSAIGKVARAFVSAGLGNDSNIASNCAVSAPCRSFATAVGVVSPGGEVVALDTGDYGAVTLTNSVTLAGVPGVHAGISVSSGNAVNIATPGVHVFLRGLSLSGSGYPTNGIAMSSGASLTVDGCVLSEFGDAISVTGPTQVAILATTVRNAKRGIYLGDGVKASIAKVKVWGGFDWGIVVGGRSPFTKTVVGVVDTVVTGARRGALEWAVSAISSDGTAEVALTVVRSVLTNSDAGLMANPMSGMPVRTTIASSRISGNNMGFQGETLWSLGNNVVTDNGHDSFATVIQIPRQ